MSKLKKEELLEILRDIKLFIKSERIGWWDEKDEEAHQQIKEMIKKPGVTEEWIEEEAWKMKAIVATLFRRTGTMNCPVGRCKDFIRSIVKEIQGEK